MLVKKKKEKEKKAKVSNALFLLTSSASMNVMCYAWTLVVLYYNMSYESLEL